MYVLGEDDDDIMELVALDSEDGSEIYRKEVSGRIEDGIIVGGGKLYQPSRSSLIAYDIDDGSKEWEVDVEEGLYSVYYDDGIVYAAGSSRAQFTNDGESYTVALDSSDGHILWDVYYGEFDGDFITHYGASGGGIVATDDAVYAAGGTNETNLKKFDKETGDLEDMITYASTNGQAMERVGDFIYIPTASNREGIKVADIANDVPLDPLMDDIFGDDDTQLFGLTSNFHQLQRLP